MAVSAGPGEALASFLATRDEEHAARALGELIERHATPLIAQIVRYRLASAPGDADDVCSIVTMQLMTRLRRERHSSSSPITSFASYVATAAHHGCDQFLRTRQPLRWRLRNRIRHVLEHDGRFALWKIADTWACGLSAWRGMPASHSVGPWSGLASIPVDAVDLLLLRLFPAAGAPLELSAVVDAAAAAWGIPPFRHDGSADLDTVVDPRPRVDDVLDQRVRLTRVWEEVRSLPLRQRHALLLNLRDDAVTVLLTSGAVTLRGIADVLELEVHELAALWNELPLADNRIAARLGCTRQQVINLRMSARKRLGNRLSGQANIGEVRSL